MKQLLRYLSLFGAITCALLFLAACVERFEVIATNHRSERVIIGIAQYHSENFNGTPPKSFPTELLIQQQEVSLGPGERRTLVFNSASGGFWLRWRQVDPLSEPNTLVTIDLIRDARAIDIQ